MEIIDQSWRKASYSGNGGMNCVEVSTTWRKASYSGNGGGNCVEVAQGVPGGVAVRDSKDPDGPRLVFTAAGWRAFTARLKTGKHTLV
jgi:hypothetical protein